MIDIKDLQTFFEKLGNGVYIIKIKNNKIVFISKNEKIDIKN